VAQLVEALLYKSEGRGFDSRWCHWNFKAAVHPELLPTGPLKKKKKRKCPMNVVSVQRMVLWQENMALNNTELYQQNSFLCVERQNGPRL
jgi:hypothetical protein